MGDNTFPRYLLKVDGIRRFLPFHEAVAAYNGGFQKVIFGRYTLNEDFSVHEMTEEEKEQISKAAEAWDENK